MPRPTPRKGRRTRTSGRAASMVFGRRNYLYLIASVVAVVVGYALMRLDNQIDGFISLFVAPIIITLGYVGVLVAMLVRSETPDTAHS